MGTGETILVFFREVGAVIERRVAGIGKTGGHVGRGKKDAVSLTLYQFLVNSKSFLFKSFKTLYIKAFHFYLAFLPHFC
jgi:hypothetical protein